MKAVVKTNHSKFELVQVPKLICGKNEILVRMTICGICGSDIRNIFYKSCMPTNHIGHELSGIIVDVGSNVQKFKINDRVFVHHHASCNECNFCLHDNQTMCEKFRNDLNPCGMAEEFLVSEWLLKNDAVLKIPQSMNFNEAALIEPLACCIRAWKKIKQPIGNSMAIFGAGPMGMMFALLGKFFGIEKIYCIDINYYRLNFCKEKKIGIPININNNNNLKKISSKNTLGLDLIIIATSETSVINEGIDLLRKGGTILLFGEPNEKCILKIDFSKIYSKEISIIPSYAASIEDVKESFQLINNKKINVNQLITHKFPLTDVIKALHKIDKEKNFMKSIITNL